MRNDDTHLNGRRRVATVGTFDGLHRGHRRVLSTVKAEAEKRKMEPLVITFDRHPLETIAPRRAPLLIQSPSERTNSLYREGLSLLTLEFTHEMASLSAADWLARMHSDHGVDVLVVGYDNTFGSDGTGMSIADYKRLGELTGVEVVAAPYEPKAASSAIRNLLAEGDIYEANRLLGYPFTIWGEVVAGKHLGTGLGFPTANILPSYRALFPKKGVYAVDVDLPDGRRIRSVANVGHQPTVVDDAPLTLEVHIPGFDEDLYGRRLGVRFIRRIRDEKKFNTIKELKQQIARDVSEAAAGKDSVR